LGFCYVNDIVLAIPLHPYMHSSLQASGFCYVNDIVLAILELLKVRLRFAQQRSHTQQ
jgi:acetoin utilization deacetylase AcuC-like enzyme